MAHPHRTYQPRDNEPSVLHAVIREHLEPFLREVLDRDDASGLPRFVEREFREFLTFGVLAHGFTRLRCADGTFERLVPFAIAALACPHCGGRLRLIATLHDPAVIRKILAHVRVGPSGPSPGPAPREPGAAAS